MSHTPRNPDGAQALLPERLLTSRHFAENAAPVYQLTLSVSVICQWCWSCIRTVRSSLASFKASDFRNGSEVAMNGLRFFIHNDSDVVRIELAGSLRKSPESSAIAQPIVAE